MAKKPEPKKTTAKAKKTESADKPVKIKADKKPNASLKAKPAQKKKKPKEITEFMGIINAPNESQKIIKKLHDRLNLMAKNITPTTTVGFSGAYINSDDTPTVIRIGYLQFDNDFHHVGNCTMWRSGPLAVVSLIAMCEQFLECRTSPTSNSYLVGRLEEAFIAAWYSVFSPVKPPETEPVSPYEEPVVRPPVDPPADPPSSQDADATPLEPTQPVQTPSTEVLTEASAAVQEGTKKTSVGVCIECLMHDVFALHNKTALPTLSLLREYVGNRTRERLKETIRSISGLKDDPDFEDTLEEMDFESEVAELEGLYGPRKPLSDFIEVK